MTALDTPVAAFAALRVDLPCDSASCEAGFPAMMSSAVIGLAGRMASLHAAGGAGAQSFPSATLFAAIGFALLLTLGGYILWRRRRTPAELRGNWWPRFEREFHAYTQHAADIASDTVRRRQQRPPFG